MKVKELIAKLEDFENIHGDLEVSITDGFQAHVYEGDFKVQHYIETNGIPCCDIGIGGMNINPM